MSKSHTNTLRLCRVGVLAALYVPLTLYVGVSFGNVKISFGSLPVIVAALLCGPVEGFLVPFIGSFFHQLLTYGVTATTVLYLIPPALRGLIVGAVAVWFWRKRGSALENQRILCYIVCILAAMVTTTGNTLVNWLDSVLYHYFSYAYVFGDALLRFGVGMLNAVVIATVAIPLVKLLRRRGLAGTMTQLGGAK